MTGCKGKTGKGRSYGSNDVIAEPHDRGPDRNEDLKFALPLFLGNLFQQLYNIADTLIVGNMLGNQALAAVSSTGSLVFVLVSLFSGVFTGAGVVVSRFFGAKDENGCSRPSIRRWPSALPPVWWS